MQLAVGVHIQRHRLQAPRQVRHIVQVLVHVDIAAAGHLHRAHDLRQQMNKGLQCKNKSIWHRDVQILHVHIAGEGHLHRTHDLRQRRCQSIQLDLS